MRFWHLHLELHMQRSCKSLKIISIFKVQRQIFSADKHLYDNYKISQQTDEYPDMLTSDREGVYAAITNTVT